VANIPLLSSYFPNSFFRCQDQRGFKNSGSRSAIPADTLRDLRELRRTRLVLAGARQLTDDLPNDFLVAKKLEN
jgi:hypothetical protein